jgi:hypothetical protein
LFAYNANAQKNLSPSVIAASGGVSKFSDIELEWTLGESAVGAALSSDRFYSIGFHQPVLISKELLVENNSFHASIFPNPVNNLLNVHFQSARETGIKLIFLDMYGRALREKTIAPNLQNASINVHGLISGIYYLKVIDAKGYVISKYKIFKIN